MRSWLGTGKSLQSVVTVCCLIAFILFGYEQGVFGGILQNQDWFNQSDYPSDSKIGIIVGCYNLECLVGFVLNFFMGEMLGRCQAIWIAMGFFIIGAVLQSMAYNVAHLVLGRIITGFGGGLKISTVPMYQAELCDGKVRRRLVSAKVLLVGVGIVIEYWLDFGMSYIGGAIGWCLQIAFKMVFAIVVSDLVFALPESPRRLYNHGRETEAVEVLCAVYDKDSIDEYIVQEKNTILRAIEMEESAGNSKSLLAIFKNDDVKAGYRVLLAWGIQFMNQVGGINLIVYYSPSVLVQNVGITPYLAQILGGCINMMFMFGSILPSFALDRMDRRKTMMCGCFGLGICMMMISALISQPENTNGHAYAPAAIAFFFLYMLIFGMSVNCVP